MKKREPTIAIFNASLKLKLIIVVRNTVKFNFSFLTEEKLKTKTKHYLAPAYPKALSFRNRTKHSVALAPITRFFLFEICFKL